MEYKPQRCKKRLEVALLAAGKGKRLLPATEVRPKPLLPIAGSTLFEYNLLLVQDASPIYAVVSYRRDLFSELSKRYHFSLVDQGDPLGTGHAVLKLENYVKEDFLLIYSDIYLPPGTKDLITSLADRYDHIVAVSPVDKPWEFGVIEQKDGLLMRIVEKPSRGEEPSNLVIAGAFYLSQSIFDHLKKIGFSPRGEIELTDALTLAAQRGERIGIVKISPWIDAGRPSDFLEAQKLLLQDIIMGRRKMPENFKLEGNILISEGAEIISSEIHGPLAIGHCEITNSRLGTYVYLEDGSQVVASKVDNSIIMKGSMVESSEVKNSLITDLSEISKSKLTDVVTASSIKVRNCHISAMKIWEDQMCST